MPIGSNKKLVKSQVSETCEMFANITGGGASNPTVNYTAGVSTVTRQAAGTYRFSFAKPMALFMGAFPTLALNASANMVVEARPYVAPSGSTLGYVDLVCRIANTGTATDLGTSDVLNVVFKASDSTLSKTRH